MLPSTAISMFGKFHFLKEVELPYVTVEFPGIRRYTSSR